MSTISSSLWPIVAAMFVFTVFGQLTSATRGIRLYDGYKLVRATPASHRQIAALQDLYKSAADYPAADIDFWKFRPQTGQANEIFVGPGGEDRLRHFLKEHQIAHQTLVDDLGIEMREAGEAARLDEPEEMFFSAEEFDLGRYHRYDSIVRYLQLLAQSHPQFMRFGSIGKSFEGRDLAIIKLGYPSSNNASSKPIMLLDAGIHAREWIAPAVALHVVNALVNDAKWNDLLRYIDVHVIPSVNPDGYTYSWGKDRLWRRTRSGPYPTNGACAQMAQQEGQMVGSVGGVFNEEPTMCYGTDPNRNFPFHWAESGTDACPCSEVFPGPQPLSEPEAAHLAAYMSSNRQLIKAYLTLHSYGNLLIHAWNYARKTYPEEVDDIKAQAERMVQAIVQSHGAKFAVGSAPDILYEAAGGSDDFASSLGIKYSYTMELTSGSFEKFHGGFIYPERAINQEAAKVLPGIYELAAKVKEIGGNF